MTLKPPEKERNSQPFCSLLSGHLLKLAGKRVCRGSCCDTVSLSVSPPLLPLESFAWGRDEFLRAAPPADSRVKFDPRAWSSSLVVVVVVVVVCVRMTVYVVDEPAGRAGSRGHRSQGVVRYFSPFLI